MRHSLAVGSLVCAAIVELGCSNVQSLTAPSPIAHATVTAATQAIVVSLTPAAVSGAVGDSAVVSAAVTDTKGNAATNAGFSWSIKDTTVATVTTGGRIHMKKVGATRVVASTSGDTASAAVTVAAASTTPVAQTVVVSLTPSTVSGKVGDSAVVAAAVTDTKGNAVSGATVSWTMNDTTVATITASGHVHMKKAGSTRVVASSSGDTASAGITVAAVAAVAVTTTPAPTTDTVKTTKPTAPVAPVIASGVEYGVHSDLSFDENVSQITAGIQQVSALHAKVQRGSFLWHHIESTQGTYNWTYTDAVVSQSLAANVDPLMVVYGSPSWANGTPTSTSNYYLYVPQDSAAFATWVSEYAAFMSAAATRYKGQVKKWELWNEENQHYFWLPTPNVQQYITWYRAVSAAILAADPSTTVAVGGLTGLTAGPASDYTGAAFLSDLYAAGLQPQAVAIHPYSSYGPTTTQAYQNSFSDIATIHQIMVANGQSNAPLWVTEWGWDNNVVGAATAATYITQSLNLIATQYTYVTVAAYFQLEDGGGYTYGLYDASATIRAGGTAFQTFAIVHGQ